MGRLEAFPELVEAGRTASVVHGRLQRKLHRCRQRWSGRRRLRNLVSGLFVRRFQGFHRRRNRHRWDRAATKLVAIDTRVRGTRGEHGRRGTPARGW